MGLRFLIRSLLLRIFDSVPEVPTKRKIISRLGSPLLLELPDGFSHFIAWSSRGEEPGE